MFSVGTKSLLIGAHWPPHILQVILAWRWLYGQWPSAKEIAAICLHDVGYWGCQEMDGDDGTRHPELGARLADRWLGPEYGQLIRGHSKGYAQLSGMPVSKLYGPDKAAHAFVWTRSYVLRTRLTGELAQYRAVSRGGGQRTNTDAPDDRWFRVVRARLVRAAATQAIDALAPDGLGSYLNR